MTMQSNIRIIELLRFLYQQTDEAHAVTVSEMIEYLKSKGIPSVRQTVYTDLEALDTAGIDIVQIKSTQNRYFIGSRIFEYPELKMLVDAVASSKVISAKKSQALIQKLGQLTSIQQAEQLQRLASLSSRVKPHNEKVYYIIDSIQTAILDQHQISFQYYEYTPEKKKILKHDGYRYILDPYALEWKNDHYYLIGYSHKHKGIAHFRVDRLTSVEPLDSKFQPMPDFDVAAYTNKMVDMFAAEHAEQVKLLCSNELMRVIIDHYGEDIEISPYDDTHFTVIIEVNPSGTFYGWVFKFMGKIRILSPQSCVDKMQDIARTFI
ncbi:WYL domain-containing protein [Pseudoflavonifractor sp. DSM 107456]|uniref:WYL domain-containing protein n=2 Tax=Pseudoflavonifractor gallinarum TaxID=2779352 RepID=A0ABR9R9R0_9FIRM|nr:WYL domain-containing protein [Pseudoflavonifractor gallinarum]MBE5055409.1 WYL domain-containing protein [Pseudoflavonifractor gallinarum]